MTATKRKKFVVSLCMATMACTLLLAQTASAAGKKDNARHHLFLRSARENADFTRVTLPLYRGTSNGQPVWYIITDASSPEWAARLGVNYAPKLANAAGGHGSQLGTGNPLTGIDFPGTVDFRPDRILNIGDYGQCAALPFLPFGPDCFRAGAQGDANYSPLVEIDDGTVLNASHVANHTGKADKGTINGTFTEVTFDETKGGGLGHVVYYMSTDASVPPGAVLENVTNAPLLANVPKDPDGPQNENRSHLSARAGIIAFTNGQTGLNNPNRQGLNSTIVDSLPVDSDADNNISPPVPLNIIQFVPAGDTDPGFPLYSPLWDVHFATWQVPYAQRTLQKDFNAILGSFPQITNPFGDRMAPNGPVANCPIVSIDRAGGHDDD